MWLSWAVTILLSAAAVWVLPVAREPALNALRPASLWQALWPAGGGILISGGAWLMALRKKRRPIKAIPQGDLLYVFSSFFYRIHHFGSSQFHRIRQFLSPVLKDLQAKRPRLRAVHKRIVWIENRLSDWQTAALIFVILIGCLFTWSLRS
jgi:hypothetical protein